MTWVSVVCPDLQTGLFRITTFLPKQMGTVMKTQSEPGLRQEMGFISLNDTGVPHPNVFCGVEGGDTACRAVT